MRFFKRRSGKKDENKKQELPSTPADDSSSERRAGKKGGNKKLIRIPNPHQDDWIGTTDHFLVEEDPDLAEIFSNPNASPPEELTPDNRKHWEEASQKGIRVTLAVAYMSHPSFKVRARTIDYAKKIDASAITIKLVALLVDPTPVVREKAARVIYEYEGSDGCRYALDKLQDEFEGYADLMGYANSVKALRFLVEQAPDAKSRKAIMQTIKDKGLPY